NELCDIIGVKNKEQSLGITIEQSLKFFDKYKLGLRVWDIYGILVKEHVPKPLNKHITPQIMDIVIYNNHAIAFTKEGKGPKQTLARIVESGRDKLEDIVKNLEPSSQYIIKKESPLVDDMNELHF